MSGHTPGPWVECGHDRGGCQCRMVWSRTSDGTVATAIHHKAIACVHQEWGDGKDMIYGDFPPEEVAANARLIAASPDLLGAAKAAFDLLTVLGGESADLASGHVPGEMLRNAIAKAEGK